MTAGCGENVMWLVWLPVFGVVDCVEHGGAARVAMEDLQRGHGVSIVRVRRTLHIKGHRDAVLRCYRHICEEIAEWRRHEAAEAHILGASLTTVTRMDSSRLTPPTQSSPLSVYSLHRLSNSKRSFRETRCGYVAPTKQKERQVGNAAEDVEQESRRARHQAGINDDTSGLQWLASQAALHQPPPSPQPPPTPLHNTSRPPPATTIATATSNTTPHHQPPSTSHHHRHSHLQHHSTTPAALHQPPPSPQPPPTPLHNTSRPPPATTIATATSTTHTTSRPPPATTIATATSNTTPQHQPPSTSHHHRHSHLQHHSTTPAALHQPPPSPQPPPTPLHNTSRPPPATTITTAISNTTPHHLHNTSRPPPATTIATSPASPLHYLNNSTSHSSPPPPPPTSTVQRVNTPPIFIIAVRMIDSQD
ncbi:uncharacterized protein LOC126995345 [Eriocheir sinensis]|uniref:uncharacterized protein LOC126995345 n=1 Tax=Eriocheir sinensis TaxID=95602 RepID=UPI0021CA8B7B|nr:uncharacterized protein LOC126995345 [Eriocheir sinensis]